MNKNIKAIWTILIIVFATSCNKPDDSNSVGNNNQQNDSIIENSDTINIHDYVDLGLPSGTLWATCNVGADTPEGFGDFFAWGETTTKGVYAWKNYKYGRLVNERYELNKYCTDSSFGLDGFIDNLNLLEFVDDAATVCWGTDWRMPTKDEWEELFHNTIGTWCTQKGVNGWLFTASNEKSIFLPAAGYWWNNTFNANLGLYWSSSINKEFPYRAWGFHFNTDSGHLCGSSDRNRGQTVRAVRCRQ